MDLGLKFKADMCNYVCMFMEVFMILGLVAGINRFSYGFRSKPKLNLYVCMFRFFVLIRIGS